MNREIEEKEKNQKWNEIFLLQKENVKEYIQQNEEIYNSVKEETYTTLDACVTHAIENKNHTAFAHFFLEKAKKQEKVFFNLLSDYIKEYEQEQKKNEKLVDWKKFQILRSEYWQSPDFEYEDDIEDEYFYSCQMLDLWRKDNHNIPDKDAIIQCCLYLGKNKEETNKLLIAAGNATLYELDIIDVISGYYLNLYQKNFDVSPLEKLKETKKAINETLWELLNKNKTLVKVRSFKDKTLKQNELRKEEEKLLEILGANWNKAEVTFNKIEALSEETKDKYGIDMEKITYSRKGDKVYNNIYIYNPYLLEEQEYVGDYLRWEAKKKELKRFEKKKVLTFGKTEKFILTIEDEIKQYRKILEENKESGISNADFLTKFYQNQLEKHEHIEDYIKVGQINDELIFKQKRYGYLQKTIEYLKGYPEYMKNLQYSSLELAPAVDRISLDDLEKRGQFIDRFSENFAQNKRETTSTYLHLVNAIWQISNAISKKGYQGWIDDGKKNQGSYKVKTFIEGRNIVNGKAYQVENNNREKMQNVYVIDALDKLSLMKYAIATGREEETGQYLKYAGFWKKDLLGIANLEKEVLISRIDILFLYTLKYRDALIKKWAKAENRQNEVEYTKRVRKNFPFIKLLMIINRDILFIAEKILRYNFFEIKDLKKEMIYYVKDED